MSTSFSGGALYLDVMVLNNTEIDWEVFDMWLDGAVEGICVKRIREGYTNENLSFEVVQADLQNNFRLFNMLEPILHQPTIFAEQLVWQMEAQTKEMLISRYYALDNSVARELMGRKLSGRLRKDLDEISEKTGVSLRACRRQFDNIKRVFKVVEELPGRFVSNIMSLFNLSEELALKYSVILFIGVHRFETTKKKLSGLTFADFSLVSQAILRHWTTGVDVDEYGDPVLDRDFLSTLREMKVIQDREKELKNIFIKTLSKTANQRLASEMSSFFKTFNRNLITIGSTLYHSKEMKEIFISSWEKVVEPLKQQRFSPQEVKQIVDSYEATLQDLHFSLDTELRQAFVRFFSTFKILIITFYKVS